MVSVAQTGADPRRAEEPLPGSGSSAEWFGLISQVVTVLIAEERSTRRGAQAHTDLPRPL